MTVLSSRELQGKKVISQDGREIGQLESIEIDAAEWKVTAMSIKLERAVLDALHLKRPLIGSRSVSVRIDYVSGIADSIVLKSKLDELSAAIGAEEPSSEG